jgi:hypothetical protein
MNLISFFELADISFIHYRNLQALNWLMHCLICIFVGNCLIFIWKIGHYPSLMRI